MVRSKLEPDEVEGMMIDDELVVSKDRMKEIPEDRREGYRKVRRYIARDHSLRGLIGAFVDVDTLQMALKDAGFDQHEHGDEEAWYENVVEKFDGYTAKLGAKKGGNTYEFVVSSQFNMPMIEKVALKS